MRARVGGHVAAFRARDITWRLVGVVVGVLAYAGAWVLVAAGATSLEPLLVTFPIIVVLIAAGNYLQHWLGITRRPPRFAEPDRARRLAPPEEEGTPR